MQRTQKTPAVSGTPPTGGGRQNKNKRFVLLSFDFWHSALSGSFVLSGSVPSRKKGFTLIEALVALSIIALAVIGPLSLAATSLSAAQVARDQLTAYYLAQEGIEVIRNVRDTNRLSAGTTWTKDWFDTCGAETMCAVKVDGAQAVSNKRIMKETCYWTKGDMDEAIEKCLTSESANDTLLKYDDTLVGGVSGTERGLFGYDSSYRGDTDFRRIVIMEEMDADPETIQVTSVVSWLTSFGKGRPRMVKLTEYLKHLE